MASSYTFTNAGLIGPTGPTQAQLNTAYPVGNSLNGLVTTTNGIQLWTVPKTGSYTIEATGASGGTNQYGTSCGRGALMKGTFTLTQGTVLKILVGQKGVYGNIDGGGGGGTFVTDSTNQPLIVAGGGGGRYQTIDPVATTGDASLTTAGKGNSNGNRGRTGNDGGGGGGLLTNGATVYAGGGASFLNGGAGGYSGNGSGTGGFGGGSGGENNAMGASGAGGGYSGGNYGVNGNGGTSEAYGGGGGGSYNNGTNQSNAVSLVNMDGLVVVTYQVAYPINTDYVITSVNSFNLTGLYLTGITCVQGLPTNTIIRYLLSFDGKTSWKVFDGTLWKTVLLSDIRTSGMTLAQIQAITKENFLLVSSGTVDVAGLLYTTDSSVTPSISSISYKTTPISSRNDIRYAFSVDNKVNWIVFQNGNWVTINISQLSTLGMTSSQVSLLLKDQFNLILKDTLDVAMQLINNDSTVTPSIDKISISYVQYQTPLVVNSVLVPVPNSGYTNMLTDEINIIYTLKLADGLCFDDANVDYNFYTTPDKIKIRPLDLGTIIGGRSQSIFVVEIINSYASNNFEVTLRSMTTDKVVAEEKISYGLLYDSSDPLGRTKVELSTDPTMAVNSYPLVFNLNAGQRKIVYIRITPTIYNTVGTKQSQLKLTGRSI